MVQEEISTYRSEKLMKCIILLAGEHAALWTLDAVDKAFIAACVGKTIST